MRALGRTVCNALYATLPKLASAPRVALIPVALQVRLFLVWTGARCLGHRVHNSSSPCVALIPAAALQCLRLALLSRRATSLPRVGAFLKVTPRPNA
eukprot:COSAG01_NODE_1999_length_8688_cov_6.237280_7_plen_97_part_00